MLKTRVITALVLLAVLLLVAFSGSYLLFAGVTVLFFAAAAWENQRLFAMKFPLVGAAIWTIGFAVVLLQSAAFNMQLLFVLCVAIWVLRLIPSLSVGLPPVTALSNRLLGGVYGIALVGCFLAIAALFQHSPLYLLSVMAIVWVADIGAYFSGKAFGRRKLAPSISPGKSWEGAIGGAIAVLFLAALSTTLPGLNDTFATQLLTRGGWLIFFIGMTMLVAASIVGDLFESQLKRRVGFKDSSQLLPGHGGVLDRIDALIPALPLAAFIDYWL